MKTNKYEFPMEFEGKTFKFKVDRDNLVWLITSEDPESASNIDHTPAQDEEDAKKIAAVMLYGMGLIKKSSCEMYLKNQSS